MPQVVVTEEYVGQRSDELTLKYGDVINVLYKDTESWWLGQSASTYLQGFFPTNHVVPLKSFKSEPSQDENFRESGMGVDDNGGNVGIGGTSVTGSLTPPFNDVYRPHLPRGKSSISASTIRKSGVNKKYGDSETPGDNNSPVLTAPMRNTPVLTAPGIMTPGNKSLFVHDNLKEFVSSVGKKNEGGGGKRRVRFDESGMVMGEIMGGKNVGLDGFDDGSDGEGSNTDANNSGNRRLPGASSLSKRPSSANASSSSSSRTSLSSPRSSSSSSFRNTTSFIDKDLYSKITLSKDHYQERRREVWGVENNNQSTSQSINLSTNQLTNPSTIYSPNQQKALNKPQKETEEMKTTGEVDKNMEVLKKPIDPITSRKPPIGPTKKHRSRSAFEKPPSKPYVVTW